VLESTLWASAHHDPAVDYAPVVDALVLAGAAVRQEYLDWIRGQQLFLPDSKPRMEERLRRALTK
jgi:hypothetical protein